MCPWIFLYHELNFNPRSHEGSDLCRRWIRRSIMISIHAPTRGATCFTHYDFPFLLYFNPRSHEGSDRYLLIIFLLADRFQSTLPRGERQTVALWKLWLNVFQSTLPRGERQPTTSSGNKSQYFNPRSHEGSDAQKTPVLIKSSISIHAPTRGATYWQTILCFVNSISIHAPTRGATILG